MSPQDIVGNLLVVDDEYLNRELITAQLKKTNHTFTIAKDGQEALDQLSQHTFDIVLLDIMMPGMNGFEVLAQIRKKYTLIELPVILVTALVDSEDVVQGLNLGANDYLTKPIVLDILLARIQTQLSLKQVHSQKITAEDKLRKEADERKQSDIALQESDNKYRNLFQQSRDGIFIYDLEGVLQDVNDQFCQMLGYAENELLSHWVSDFRPSKLDDFMEGVYQELLEKKSVRFESQFIKKSGDIIDVDISASIFDEDKGLGQAIVRDITQQKQAAITLQESETQYRNLFEQSNDGIFIHDLDGKILDLNNRACEILGYSADQLLHKLLSDFRPKNLDAAAEEGFQKVLEEGSAHFEFQFITRTGGMIDVDISARFIDPKKGIIQGVVRDITDSKKAQADLQYQNTLLSAQQEATLDGILVTDGKGNWLSHNKQFIDMWKVPPEISETMSSEISFKWVLDHVANPEKFKKRMWYIYANPKEKSRDEIETIDGRTLDRYSSPMYGETGEYYGRFWNFRDITTVKKIEDRLRQTNEELEHRVQERTAALQKSEVRFRTLIEQAADAMFVYDQKGKFLEVNQSACDSLGYTQNELLNLSVADISTQLDQAQVEAVLAAIKVGKSITVEGIHVRKDGSQFPVEVRIGRLALDDDILMLALARDVTHRKQLEEQLLQAQKMEAVGKLAGGVAHDFNNLLTVINGYSRLSLNKLEKNDPNRDNIELIQKAGERAAALTNQLLAFSRRQMLQPKVVDLNQIVVNLQKMLHRLIGEDIELSVQLNSKNQVEIDPSQLEQVIMNLTVNAQDAMPQGGKLTLKTTDINLDTQFVRQYENLTPGAYVLLTVQDTGEGIDPQTLNRIFEPFFTTKEQGKGTGLGLSTAYGIIAQSGGCLIAESQKGQGTTFYAYLPQYTGPVDTDTSETNEMELTKGSEMILLVEDEDMTRTLAQHILKELGYQVLSAENGTKALQLYQQHKDEIDLVLTDVIMPQMGGKELADHILTDQPNLKILFMSGYTDDKIDQQDLLKSGANFLQKPFLPEDLSAKLQELFDR